MIRFFILTLAIAATILVGIAGFSHYRLAAEQPYSYQEAVMLGAEYLVRHTNEDGSFVYEYNPITDTASRSYNILRHAGTTYSLIETYAELQRHPEGEDASVSSEELRQAIDRALEYLMRHAAPCPAHPGALCVAEEGEIKLGGNALAILALATHAQVFDSPEHLDAARGLAEFLLRTQSREGEFTIHKMSSTGEKDVFVSGYYPGEALFALTQLAAVTEDERYWEAAHRGAKWLIEVRDGGKPPEALDHDHWLLYALAELYAHRPDPLYLAHTERLVAAITSAQHRNLPDKYEKWNGGYYSPPRSTPTATRTEGLMAAHRLCTRAGASLCASDAINSARLGAEFQLRTLMTPRKAAALGAAAESIGGFHESLDDYTIRIDFVQHNISALLALMHAEEK